ENSENLPYNFKSIFINLALSLIFLINKAKIKGIAKAGRTNPEILSVIKSVIKPPIVIQTVIKAMYVNIALILTSFTLFFSSLVLFVYPAFSNSSFLRLYFLIN